MKFLKYLELVQSDLLYLWSRLTETNPIPIDFMWHIQHTRTAWKLSKYGVISGLYFPVFGLNTEIYEINLRIQSAYRKIRTRNNSVFGQFSRSDGFTLIHVDAYHGSKGDFPAASCAVTSLKMRNHYTEANLTVVVLSAEDCCASSIKLWVLKKVVLFIV